MRRIAIGAAGLALAMLPAMNAAADSNGAPPEYQQVRSQLSQCNLDLSWHQLSSERRAECNDLFRRFVMFTDPKENSSIFVHCRSASDCIPTPEGEPDAAGPIPAGMDVYDVQPKPAPKKVKKAARAAHRHRR